MRPRETRATIDDGTAGNGRIPERYFMAKIAIVISWLGGAAFTYFYVMRVGNLRDDGKDWMDALLHENDLVLFGAVGLFTMVAMTIFG